VVSNPDLGGLVRHPTLRVASPENPMKPLSPHFPQIFERPTGAEIIAFRHAADAAVDSALRALGQLALMIESGDPVSAGVTAKSVARQANGLLVARAKLARMWSGT
jgi:hypothetical protein